MIVDNSNEWYQEKKDILASSDLPYRYYKNDENIGALGNWNRCVELAQTDIITFLHDDDFLLEGFSKFILNNVSKVKEFSFVNSNRMYFYGDIKSQEKKTKTAIVKIARFLTHWVRKKLRKKYFRIETNTLARILFQNQFGNGLGVLIYKEFFFEVDGFDEKYYIDGDYHLAIKLTFLKGRNYKSSDVTSTIDVTLSLLTKEPFACAIPDKIMKESFISLTRFPLITKMFCYIAYKQDLLNIQSSTESSSKSFMVKNFLVKFFYQLLLHFLAPLIIQKNRSL